METLVKPLLHCQLTIVCVMKGFHTISGGKQAGQKHYTPNTRDMSADPEGWRRPPVVGICKATRECVRLTSGAALWKQKCWKCVFVCQLGVRVDWGLLKSFRYSLRRSSIMLKQETGWRYAVFTCKGVLLIIRDENEPRVWRHLHLSLRSLRLAEVAFQWPSDDSHQKYNQFPDTVTVVFIHMGISTEDADEWLPRGRSILHIRSDIPLKVSCCAFAEKGVNTFSRLSGPFGAAGRMSASGSTK